MARIAKKMRIKRIAPVTVIGAAVELQLIMPLITRVIPNLRLTLRIAALDHAARFAKGESHHLLVEVDPDPALPNHLLLLESAAMKERRIFPYASLRARTPTPKDQPAEKDHDSEYRFHRRIGVGYSSQNSHNRRIRNCRRNLRRATRYLVHPRTR